MAVQDSTGARIEGSQSQVSTLLALLDGYDKGNYRKQSTDVLDAEYEEVSEGDGSGGGVSEEVK